MAVPKGQRVGGRQKGTPNKATADVKALAQQHTAAAMKELARLSTKAESEAARVAAIRELFDRAYGKPSQALKLGGDEDGVPIETVIRWASNPAEGTADPSAK